MSGGTVAVVEPGSIAASLGILPGDVLFRVNGHPLRDVLDVQFYAADEELDLLVRRGDQELLYQVEREYGVSLGLGFASPTFDGLRRCRNHCDFCFVSQMPRDLRRSLYVRDDDYRYSLLYGSFVTLTNLTPDDWERLAEQRLSPLYVSVQATELDVRRRLLGRDDIPDVLRQIERLAKLGIQVHTQVVLIPGSNDGPHLIRTLNDLADRHPAVLSIGVVPVGVTRYHTGSCRVYTSEEARAVVTQVAPLQRRFRARHGVSLAYLADEWYLLAGLDVPKARDYDDYPQIENGIGLVRQFLDDSHRAPVGRPPMDAASCTLVCGTLVAPIMERVARDWAARSGCEMEVVPVVNRLFGDTVTVSGLLSGQDVLAALRERDLGEVVLLPGTMFASRHAGAERGVEGRAEDAPGSHQVAVDRTLDEWTVGDLARRLGRPVVVAGLLSELGARERVCLGTESRRGHDEERGG